MMGTEMVPEATVIFNQLTWLVARKDFNNFSRHESFTSYKKRLFPYMVLMGWSLQRKRVSFEVRTEFLYDN
jgi:hypothetical protein